MIASGTEFRKLVWGWDKCDSFSKGPSEKEMWCVSIYTEIFTCQESQTCGEFEGRGQRKDSKWYYYLSFI